MQSAISPHFIYTSFPLESYQFTGRAQTYMIEAPTRDCIVETRKIVAAPFREQLYEEYVDNVIDLMVKIHTGELDLNIARPVVDYCGGLFRVQDGRKRITAAKALGLKKIPVRAIYTEPVSVHAKSALDFTYLRLKERLGQFKTSNIEKPWKSWVMGSYARLEIESYTHVSVFSELNDYPLMKKVFDSLDATGVSSLEEFNNLPEEDEISSPPPSDLSFKNLWEN